MSEIKDKAWKLYIIQNNRNTYVGVSPDPIRRLRQHNGEICGGAKYTKSKGPGWEHVCLIEGFRTKIESMQLEWAIKHEKPKDLGGIKNRLIKMIKVLNKEKWTSKSPLAIDVPLTIIWKKKIDYDIGKLPIYIETTTL